MMSVCARDLCHRKSHRSADLPSAEKERIIEFYLENINVTHLQNVQHSELHRLGIFFSEPLDVLSISHFTELVRDIRVTLL